MMRRLLLLAALTAATLAAARCAATAQISLDPQVRQRLGEMVEIRAVHYNTPEGLPVYSKLDANMARADGFLPVEAPVRAVKDRFLAAVSQELGLTNLKIIDEPQQARIGPLMAPPIDPLKSEFGRGLVFDFYCPVWRLNRAYRPPWRLAATPRYGFIAWIRARLIRLDDSSILWQQMCGSGASKQARTLEEWLANDYGLLHAELDQVARSCADELVARFFGKQ